MELGINFSTLAHTALWLFLYKNATSNPHRPASPTTYLPISAAPMPKTVLPPEVVVVFGALLAVAVALAALDEVEEVLFPGFTEDEDGAVVVAFAGCTEEDTFDVVAGMMTDDVVVLAFVVYQDGQHHGKILLYWSISYSGILGYNSNGGEDDHGI
jgi:hypothetical protein